MAAANGYSEVLDFLLTQDEVNVNIQDSEGWTPFHGAVCWGQVWIPHSMCNSCSCVYIPCIVQVTTCIVQVAMQARSQNYLKGGSKVSWCLLINIHENDV